MKNNSEKKKSIYGICLIGGLWLALVIACFVLPAEDSSASERRKLAQFPTISKTTLLSGDFMTNFETYSQDQFPLRDSFRSLKAGANLYLFRYMDNNDLYISDGYVEKLSYPLNEHSVANALKVLNSVYDTYLAGTDTKLFLSLVPDKGYFLAEESGHLGLDYEKLFSLMQEGMPYAEYIDILPQLTLASYYKTDTHWRQEMLLPVANVLLNGLTGTGSLTSSVENPLDLISQSDYTLENATDSFLGVYAGQIALPLPGETLNYLTNDVLADCIVTNEEDPEATSVYDFRKLSSRDPYELFLSGAAAFITIENPNCTNGKELVVFRDSYGSSIVPLLISSYEKVTLIDLRYISSSYLDTFISFDNQDVLFLYSTLLLNSSYTMK